MLRSLPVTLPRARALLCVLATCAALGCGREPAPEGPVPIDEHPPGLWYDIRFEPRAALLSDEERAAFLKLGAIGYVEGIYAPPEQTGVVAWDEQRAEAGYNLYSSGHGAEAYLMDMRGRSLHEWSFPHRGLPGVDELDEPFQACWRRVRPLADGSLLAIYEGLGIARVDWDSQLVWFRRNHAHHDLDLTPDGRLFVLTRETRLEPKISSAIEVMDDYIVELDLDGNERRRVSILRALLESRWATVIREAAAAGGDVMHANTIEILGQEPRVPHPAFEPGRALVALRNLDAAAVIDLEAKRVEWFQRGPWVALHAPTVLADGRLLVFDNMGHEGYSRILAYDVEARRADTLYAGATPEDFFSIFSGAVQALSNGNLLITESYKGRAFEVTPAGETVWTFLSPHRAGAQDELVAVTFEMQRLSPEAQPWAARLDAAATMRR